MISTRYALTVFIFIALLGMLTAPSGVVAQTLPNPKLTPGLADPKLTRQVICAPHWSTKTVRNVNAATKHKVCAEYGIKQGCPGPAWEIDHLIALTEGGANEVANLWPQEIIQAKTKDRLEIYLHRQVCAGKTSLVDAQRCIARDWIACWNRSGKP